MQEKTARDTFPVIGDAIKLWTNDWANQAIVGMVAFLCSLTIVLLPASLFGVFYQARDHARGNRSGLMGFWAGFKTYWKQSLLWGIINLLVYAFLIFVIVFYYLSTGAIDPGISLGIASAFVFILLFWSIWQFLSLSCFFLQEEASMKLAWKNGWAIFLRLRAYSLSLGTIIFVFSLLSVFTLIPLVIGAEGLIAITGIRAVQATIKTEEA